MASCHPARGCCRSRQRRPQVSAAREREITNRVTPPATTASSGGACDGPRLRGRKRMSELITPDDLPRWVPGELTLDSAPLGWEGVRLRSWRYTGLDVPIPGLQDYMIVVYQDGATPMNRRCTGDWRLERVGPGSISLLTHAAQSHWRWGDDIEVTHLYLSPTTVADVAAEAYDRHIRDVELFDVLRADDPVLSGIAASLGREAQEAGLGGRLY